MPDSTIYATGGGNEDDATIYNSSTSDWATARGDASTSGTIHNDSSTKNSVGVYNRKIAGRGGGNNWLCNRSYFSFDVSGESGTVDSATVRLYLDNLGSAGNAARVVIVESTALAGSTADFGNCFSSGSTLGDLMASYAFVSTTEGYHDFDLNSDGITALNGKIGSGLFQICLMGNIYDYADADPGADSSYTRTQVSYSEYTGTSRDPKIEIDYEAAAVVANNATFFGANF